MSWRQRFVHAVYATHNRSPQIIKALDKVLRSIRGGELGLNVGAGQTDLHSAVLNLDIVPGPFIDCCAQAEFLPFASESFSVVITQETLEHVREPFLAVREMYRVLKKDGVLYCQLPFIIGYHPGPTDYWRFSKEGIQELVEQAGFTCEEINVAVGPATGFYRIAVEFVASLMSRFWPGLYHLAKGGAALLLYPIKWLDPLLLKGKQADRIAGGYYVIAHKKY